MKLHKADMANTNDDNDDKKDSLTSTPPKAFNKEALVMVLDRAENTHLLQPLTLAPTKKTQAMKMESAPEVNIISSTQSSMDL